MSLFVKLLLASLIVKIAGMFMGDLLGFLDEAEEKRKEIEKEND